MTLNETNIAETFRPLNAELVEKYETEVRAIANHLMDIREDDGFERELVYPRLSKDSSFTEWDQERYQRIKAHIAFNTEPVYVEETNKLIYKRYLDEKRLNSNARHWAEKQVESMASKTLSKIGDLEEAVLTFRGGGNFTISGKVNGKKVRAEQQTVVKFHGRTGKMFAQFPMRLYVEDKFTTASAYKKSIM